MAALTLQGVTRTYALDFGINARCRVEVATGRPFHQVLEELAGRQRPSPTTVLAFLGGLLIEPVPAATVARILKDIGGVAMIRRAVRGAVRETMPARAR